MAPADQVALLRFQLAETQRQRNELQSEQALRQMIALSDVVNALANVADQASRGVENSQKMARAFVEAIDGIRAAAASKIIVAGGGARKPVDPVEETDVAIEGGIGELAGVPDVAGGEATAPADIEAEDDPF